MWSLIPILLYHFHFHQLSLWLLKDENLCLCIHTMLIGIVTALMGHNGHFIISRRPRLPQLHHLAKRLDGLHSEKGHCLIKSKQSFKGYFISIQASIRHCFIRIFLVNRVCRRISMLKENDKQGQNDREMLFSIWPERRAVSTNSTENCTIP